jgi:hypothetical protein
MDGKELWIGLVDVIPMPNNQTLPANKGAYVTVLLDASSATDFCDGVKSGLLLYDYYVIGIEEVERFSERKTKYILSDRLLAVAHETECSGKIGLGDFHTYDKDEALM